MDFELNVEQKMIAQSAREIAKDFGPEYWYEKEENHQFPKEFYDVLGKAGFLGLGIPDEYGGTGLGIAEGVIALEELTTNGGGGGPCVCFIPTTVFGAMSILNHGSKEQKEKYLRKIARGEMIVCLSLTEPDAGTNTLNIKTFASKDGDEYVINGNKIFTSFFEDASLMVLVARTTEKEKSPRKTEGLSLFLVDVPNGSIMHNAIPKHGVNYARTYELGIDNLRVSRECLLGEEGKGWYHILDTLNPERIFSATQAIGTGRLAIKTAVVYANKRKVFDSVIGAYQGIQFPLASAYAKLESAWLMTLKAATLFDQKESPKMVGDISDIAKYVSVEAGIEAVYHAMQTFGGYGYAKEYHIERWWREIQLLRLAPITQQMTLNYIGEHILGMPRSY